MSDTKISEAAVEAAKRAMYFAANPDATEGEYIDDSTDPESAEVEHWLRISLTAALPHLHPQPAELSFDVDAMRAACVPGGSIVDPQVVADNIRAWATHRKPAELAEQKGVNLDIDDVRELFEQWAKGRDLTPDTWGVTSYVSPHVDNDFDVWRAAWKALATTGKQQVVDARCDACAGEGEIFSGALGHGIDCPRCDGTGKQQVGEVQGERERFEAWAHPIGYRTENQDGYYSRQPTRLAWDVWQAALAARQPGAQVPVTGPYLDEPDAPSNPLWKRLRSIANWLTVLAPNSHMEAAEVLLSASDRIKRSDAAPPAQGIGLGQLTRYDLNDGWDRYRDIATDKGAHLYEHADGDWVKWEDVQTLIDQRDAAPGVDNG